MCSAPPAQCLSACNVHPLLGAATSQDMKTDQIVRWRSWCAILCRTEAIIIPYFTTAGNINDFINMLKIKTRWDFHYALSIKYKINFLCLQEFLEIVASSGIKIEWSWSTDLGWYRNIGIKGLCQHPKVCKVWNFKLCPTFNSYSVLNINEYLAPIWCRYHLVSIFKFTNYLFFTYLLLLCRDCLELVRGAGGVCGRCPHWAQPPASPRSPHPVTLPSSFSC